MSVEFNIPEGSKVNVEELIRSLKWTEEKEITIEELLQFILDDDDVITIPDELESNKT